MEPDRNTSGLPTTNVLLAESDVYSPTQGSILYPIERSPVNRQSGSGPSRRQTRSPSPIRPMTAATIERSDEKESLPPPEVPPHDSGPDTLRPRAQQVRPQSDLPYSIRKSTLDDVSVTQRRSRNGLDWIVPEKANRRHTLGERLQPTLDVARLERDKYALKAKMTGYALNIAIGLQVLLGALTTGVSAATTGRQTSISTAVLGGLATIVASYLARARGTREPELSNMKCRALEKFVRECEAYQMDKGHLVGETEDETLTAYRYRLEELLGNTSQERRGETGTG